ncbi:MAG: hypothetical protein Q4C67_10185 [Deinococcus sp.]|nr:hypothetical protein [Deinococcus sp.]
MPQDHTPAQPTAVPQPAPAYEAPRVEELGAWQAITLIYSVPVNPNSPLNFNGNGDAY